MRLPGLRSWRSAWQIWTGAVLIGLFVCVTLTAPWLSPLDPEGTSWFIKEVPGKIPGTPIPPAVGLPLGSVPDAAHGHHVDVWHSMVWGTLPALMLGALAVTLAASIGMLLGASSAYLGGWFNVLGMGFTDAFLSLPIIAGVVFFQQLILMSLRATGVMILANGSYALPPDPSAWQSFLDWVDPTLLAFVIFSWMPYARIMNALAQRARKEEYIEAARVVGAGDLRIIWRHLLPNTIGPMIVLAARDVGSLVLLQAGLGFIGLSDRSIWGMLLSLGRKWIIGPDGGVLAYWWVFVPTTLIIILFGIGWSLLGDGLSDWLDPKVRRIP